MTYRLHYAPDNASLVVRLVLEELGVDYETVLIDRARREQEGDAYRALNPAGTIPVLETPFGPMSETAAILLWLTDTHGALAPGAAEAARPAYLKWLFFVSNTLHPRLRMLFYSDKYVGPDRQLQSGLRAGARKGLQADFALLEALAANRPGWFGGDMPTALDYYVLACARWARVYGNGAKGWFDIRTYPALCDMAERFELRPAALTAAQAEELGPTMFSAPHPCDPPEGSPF